MVFVALQRAGRRVCDAIFPRAANPFTTDQVLQEEAKAIHDADLSHLSGKEFNRELNKLNSAALCLSGGGIRSASFALGIIQAFAVHPRAAGVGPGVKKPEDCLLARFHYLSTVSGGGYIGSWLSAWVARAGFAEAWRKLTDRRDLPESEPQEISWLRTYSNYLTPKLGLGSADTWAALALVLRNLLLNWLVILPVLWLAIIVLKTLAVAMAWISHYSPASCFVVSRDYDPTIIFGGISFVLLIFALRFRTKNRPTRDGSVAKLGKFVRRDLLPTIVASFGLILALSPSCPYVAIDMHLGAQAWALLIAIGSGVGAAVYLVSWLLAWPKFRNAKDYFGDLLFWAIAGGIYGALLGLGVYFAYQMYWGDVPFGLPSDIVLIIVGVPWILLSQLLAEVIFAGLTSYEAGSDSDREWLARAAGLFMMAGLIWLLTMALVFVGALWAEQLLEKFQTWIAPVGGVSGVIAAALGKSSLTTATGRAKQDKPPSYIKLISDAVFAIAAVIFAALLVILSAALIDLALFQESFLDITMFSDKKVSPTGYAPTPAEAFPLLWGFLAVAFVGLVASCKVNINRFSLHALYRNRLIRAFLGASHIDHRKPNPFTGFDELDNIAVWQLWPLKENDKWPAVRGKDWQPYHVVNMALNIVSTKKLAWQERKAEAFIMSPLYSGTACGRSPDADGVMQYRGAFRKSDEYGGPEGISLGTALAISGAAASPNMGYNSSPTLAFLMTMFNVRLGWWLGNPSENDRNIYGGEGPRIAIAPLLNEMAGNTTDQSKYVYLSDGGHFENLGLYEMVRRRCRFIVVSDGGCDPGYQLDDLGNAVRKISLDLGVPIEFRGLGNLKSRADDEALEQGGGEKTKKAKTDEETEPPFHAIGLIDYAKADDGGELGLILYIKAGYHRDRIFNAGVRNYAAANADFPHQSTADQFFSESQSESYRALGFEIADRLLNETIKRLPNPGSPQPGDMIERWRKDFAATPIP